MYPATSGHESDIPVTSRQILQPFCTERLLPANHSLSIDAIKQHQHAYQNDGKGDSNTLGTAAAMQALKMFTQSNNSASSVSGQGALLGMAMTEASKLFDDKAAQGKVQGGASKENVVQQAVETAMKMYFKSQASSQGGLAGMAAKFLG
ncbi:hypothetical protein E4U54_003928 [Claviceps lovelessii]|nr:hypothetical protein E4U54_003928 [Claviceps lovelessii]